MELELLDKRIRRLVCKLKKHNIDLEVFNHHDIVYGEMLGRGGEGIVQQCTVIYNGMPIDAAVKTLQDNSDDAINITLDEIELLCLARDHVIDTTLHVYGVAAVPDEYDEEIGKLVIITEAGIMNALQLYQKEEVPMWVTYDLWSKVAAAVNTMHIRHIVHQDLKPENILITDIARNVHGQIHKLKFKVIDLGMGKRVFTEKIISEDILGTNGYHAPEVLTDESYDLRADIFTLGITFCVLLHSPDFLKSKMLQTFLKQLHASKQNGMTGKKLFQEVIEVTLPENREVPTSIKSMLWRMLEKQERRRITLVEVVNTCRIEAICAKADCKVQPPQLSPCTNGSDSGISSASHRRPPSSNPSTVISRRSSRPASRASQASRSRTSSTSSTNTSLDGCSPFKTRKRKATATPPIFDEDSLDSMDFTPIAKRVRGNSPIAKRLRRLKSTFL